MSPASLHVMWQTYCGDGGALLSVVGCVHLLETKLNHCGPRVKAKSKPTHSFHLTNIKVYA